MDKEIQYIPVGRVRRRRRTWAPDHERSGPDADGRRRADCHRDPGRGRIRSRAGSSDSFLLERGIQDEGQIPSGKN